MCVTVGLKGLVVGEKCKRGEKTIGALVSEESSANT